MKKNIVRVLSSIGLFCVLGLLSALQAQSLNKAEIDRLHQSFKLDVPTKAIQNILTNDKNIKANALNRQMQGKIDHYFKYRVKIKGINNQKSSGRCWMFTSLNVVRPNIMERYGMKEFDFSYNYLYFYDMLEKSNLFLENIIATSNKTSDDREVVRYFSSPIDDGGVWNLYYNVASKYGVVPSDVMPETEHSNNTSQMVSLIKERLRKGGMDIRKAAEEKSSEEKTDTNALRAKKIEVLTDVYRILGLCLGQPPMEFTWRYKTEDGIKSFENYTPMQFYKEVISSEYAPENYVMLMHDPTRPYYQVYEIQNYRNTYEGINWKYLNLPLEDIKKSALESIKDNEALYASCDVGKQFQRETGVLDPNLYDYNSLFGVDFTMDKKDRILSRQSGSSHAMALVGCDVDSKEQPVKWEFANSWGSKSGNKGFLTFTDDWFNEYMFRLVVNKKYLDRKAKKALKNDPISLPIWDYMF